MVKMALIAICLIGVVNICQEIGAKKCKRAGEEDSSFFRSLGRRLTIRRKETNESSSPEPANKGSVVGVRSSLPMPTNPFDSETSLTTPNRVQVPVRIRKAEALCYHVTPVSPINIETEKAVQENSVQLSFENYDKLNPDCNGAIYNIPGRVNINFDRCPRANRKDVPYMTVGQPSSQNKEKVSQHQNMAEQPQTEWKLKGIEFIYPGAHRIDNIHYDLEVQFMHMTYPQNPNSIYNIVSVLFTISEHCNLEVEELIKELESVRVGSDKQVTFKTINLNGWFPRKNTRFFSYKGNRLMQSSQAKDQVRYYIAGRSVYFSKKQEARFAALFASNWMGGPAINLPLRPANNRKISFLFTSGNDLPEPQIISTENAEREKIISEEKTDEKKHSEKPRSGGKTVHF